MLGRPSVVFVLGATGSGKSRLAIDLALALESRGGAEVINCDAIQMYRGLDVASAKTPRADRRGVPHHLLSFLAPRASFTVRDFRALAGAASVYGNTPIDVVKTRMQGLGAEKYANTFDCARQILAQEGPRAFYQGVVPQFYRITGWNIIMFVSFEQIKRALSATRE